MKLPEHRIIVFLLLILFFVATTAQRGGFSGGFGGGRGGGGFSPSIGRVGGAPTSGGSIGGSFGGRGGGVNPGANMGGARGSGGMLPGSKFNGTTVGGTIPPIFGVRGNIVLDNGGVNPHLSGSYSSDNSRSAALFGVNYYVPYLAGIDGGILTGAFGVLLSTPATSNTTTKPVRRDIIIANPSHIDSDAEKEQLKAWLVDKFSREGQQVNPDNIHVGLPGENPPPMSTGPFGEYDSMGFRRGNSPPGFYAFQSLVFTIFGLVLLLIVGSIVFRAYAVGSYLSRGNAAPWTTTEFGLLTVTLNLRNGGNFLSILEKLISAANLANPAGRLDALRKLISDIQNADVVECDIRVESNVWERAMANETAQNVASQRTERVGTHAQNVHSPEDGEGVKTGSSCVLSMVATLRSDLLQQLRSGNAESLSQTFYALQNAPNGSLDALYVYYAPNRSETLDPVSANGLYLDLIALRPETHSGAGSHA